MIARALTIAEARGARRVAVLSADLAAAIEDTIPGVTAMVTDKGVTITGRNLLRRLLSDPRLRWLGGLLR